MNRGQLRLRVIQTLALNDEAGGEEETMVHALLNEGVLDILSRTRLSAEGVELTLAAENNLYELSDSVLSMDGLYDEEGRRWIRKVPELVSAEGEYSLIGHNLLKFIPSSETRILNAFYTARPTPMTLDEHDPSNELYGGIPLQFHPAISDYACWQGAQIMEQEGSALGEKFRLLYEGKEGMGGKLGQIRRFTNRRILPAGRRRPPVDGYVASNYL